MTKQITRRTLIQSGIGLGLLSTLTWLKPYDQGAAHDKYFSALAKTLDKNKISRPTLIVDKQLLQNNIEALKQHIYPDFDYRIVAKSLPSIPMLKFIAQQSETNRFMLFNERFLVQLAKEIPDADILMGKPLPISAAEYFYAQLSPRGFRPQKQLQWLIDTPERLQQYAQLAKQQQMPMRINIELDVGLHRGGVANDETLIQILTLIEKEALLSFSGFMGYEPHIVKIPGKPENHLADAMAIYQQRIDTAETFFGAPLPASTTLNSAGSPSYRLHHKQSSLASELASGSCLVKPMDFDLPSLAMHAAASFIATPVLKQLDQTDIPGVPGLGSLMSWWNPNRQQSFFTYGGYWKANPVSPVGLSVNPVYGRSTNQEMLNGSNSVNLKPDDWVFLRPTQSEFVFLQFGDIAVYHNGEIEQWWPTFSA